MKRAFLWLGATLIVVALSGAWRWADGPNPHYLTQPVERGDLVTVLTATGEVSAVVTVTVGSQQSGQISELFVDFNDPVRRGQPIARLDAGTFTAKLRQAEAGLSEAIATVSIQRAALDKAKIDLENERARLKIGDAQVENARVIADNSRRDFDRKKTLVKRSTIAPAALEDASATYYSSIALLRAAEGERAAAAGAVPAADAAVQMAEATLRHARAAVDQQRAALDQARIDLARTVIRAPIDGVVIDRSVDRGQTVAATLEAPTLYTIAQDLRNMEVHAAVDEADIGQIRPRQQARFTVDAYPGRVFEATVSQIRKAPTLVENVVTYKVVLTAQNPDLSLLPGMTATVQITVNSATEVLKVPNAALRFRPSTDAQATESRADTVWIMDGLGRLHPIAVRLGRSDAQWTELLTGDLQVGEEVVIGTAPAEPSSWFGIEWTM